MSRTAKDIPLTKEQQALVEQYQYLIPFVIKKEKFILDPNDWWDIGAIALCHAVQSYDASKGKFFVYAYLYIHSAFKSEITQRYRQKNLTTPLSEEYKFNVNWMPSEKVDAYNDIETGTDALRVYKNLHPREQAVLSLLLRGYKQNEISTKLGVSSQCVNQRMKKIRNSFIYLQKGDS